MLAFIHLQKTAGSTVKWLLRSSYGMRHLEVPRPRYLEEQIFRANDLRFWSRFYPNLASLSGHSVVPYVDLEEVCPDVVYFSLFREPVRRMASWYQYQVQQKKGRRVDADFDEWIEKESRHNWQTRRIAGTVDVDAAIDMIQTKGIFVGIVESFDESMLLLKALVAQDLNVAYKRRRNVALATTIAQSLLESERERQMLIEANKADLQLYEYVKSELMPGYRREYGPTLAADLERHRASPGRPNYVNVNMARLKRLLLVRPLPHLQRLGVRL